MSPTSFPARHGAAVAAEDGLYCFGLPDLLIFDARSEGLFYPWGPLGHIYIRVYKNEQGSEKVRERP